MIALLAQAFQGQNLTPADLAAILLATSYNGFAGFTRAGTRNFGNGVTHDYSSTYGHGIPDMLAALQPVVSSTTPLAFVTNGTPLEGDRLAVASSGLIAGRAFGDGLQLGLSSVRALSFDALGGGFPIALNQLSHRRPFHAPLGAGFLPKSIQNHGVAVKASIDGGLDTGLVMGRNLSLNALSETLADPSRSNPERSFDWQALSIPMTGPLSEPAHAVVGLQQSKGVHWFGYATSSQSAALTGLGGRIAESSYGPPNDPNVLGISLLKHFQGEPGWGGFIGMDYRHEFETLKGSQSHGALQLGESLQTISLTPGIELKRGDWSFSALASVGINRVGAGQFSEGLLEIAEPFISTGALFKLHREHLVDHKDSAYIQVWQPERVESGELALDAPGLVGPNDPVAFQRHLFGLEPSGREINLSLGYVRPLSRQASLAVEGVVSKDSGHIRSTTPETSVVTTFRLGF
jgi:hypothetical protein